DATPDTSCPATSASAWTAPTARPPGPRCRPHEHHHAHPTARRVPRLQPGPHRSRWEARRMTTLNHHTPTPLPAALGAPATTPTKHAAEVPAPLRPITHPNETPPAPGA